MVNYQCIRCGYTTIDRVKIKNHFNRKTVCKPKLNDVNIDDYKEAILNEQEIILGEDSVNNTILSKKEPFVSHANEAIIKPIVSHFEAINESIVSHLFECEFCKKRYNHRQSLNKHLKTCKEKKKDDEDRNNLMALVNMLNSQLEEQREQLKEQKEQLKEQKEQNREQQKQIKELIKKAGVNIGTQNIQQNIKILAYKNTDLSHLTDQDYLQCLNRSNMVIPNLIKKIHFNPKKPENHNIYISNIKNKYVMIYDGGKWNLHNQDETIDDLIDTNEVVIEQKLEEWLENGKEYPEIMKKFNRYLEKKEKDDVINKIKEEIKLILFNNRKVAEIKN